MKAYIYIESPIPGYTTKARVTAYRVGYGGYRDTNGNSVMLFREPDGRTEVELMQVQGNSTSYTFYMKGEQIVYCANGVYYFLDGRLVNFHTNNWNLGDNIGTITVYWHSHN